MADTLLRLARPKPRRFAGVASNHPTARAPISDDLLACLVPSTVVEALDAPTGALRTCLEAASAPDRDFAKRSALASQRVWQWLAELEDWAWPPAPGPSGFVASEAWQTKSDDEYMGSLSAADVARYGRRLDEINLQMDELAVEDIKSHVLTNHIAPLSRPCTPMTDSSYYSSSSVSSSYYNGMNDLTAVTTTIVLQTLPDLARLSYQLRIWTSRLQVLRRIPQLLHAMGDAETSLKSAWAAITLPTSRRGSRSTMAEASQQPTLSRQDFEVMKRFLALKVAEPGPILDDMLDCLEGMPDTLPDSYLSRVEAVERDYSKWVVVSERRILESQWSASGRTSPRPRSTSPLRDYDSEMSSRPSSSGLSALLADDLDTLPALPEDKYDREAEDPCEEIATEWESSSPCKPNACDQSPIVSSSCGSTASGSPDLRTPSGRPSVSYVSYGVNNQARATSSQSDAPSLIADEALTSCGFRSETGQVPVLSPPGSDRAMTPVEDMEEPELPRLRESASQFSLSSQSSTLIFGGSSRFGALSSDPLDMSPSAADLANSIQNVRHFDDSPPRTPPRLPKSDFRELPADLLDSLVVSPPDGDASMFFKSPADQSFVDAFDETASMTGSLMQGEQLEQQISQIIESIPARIKLFSEPAPVNLNPPELRPSRLPKKPSKEPFRRNASSLSAVSSRAGTPSFTLSPVKQPRARQKTKQQDIQVYHLARSTGEPPIKLFVRCVGERGERVMVRVGGGWADLSEYLKEYVSHHGRRSAGTDNAKVEVCDVARASAGFVPQVGSSPSRPGSAAAERSPATPLRLLKARRTIAHTEPLRLRPRPITPAHAGGIVDDTPPPPSSVDSNRSRSSSRLSWYEDNSSFLGLAGPTGKKVEMSEENKAWVLSVKEKVRLASGELRGPLPGDRSRLGELSKVGGTKRLFRSADDRSWRRLGAS